MPRNSAANLCLVHAFVYVFFFFFLKLHKTECDKLDIITVPRNSSANVCNGFFFSKESDKMAKKSRGRMNGGFGTRI